MVLVRLAKKRKKGIEKEQADYKKEKGRIEIQPRVKSNIL
jgi:hypothetical protein